jgi:putative ABC transport system permease protein
MSFQAEQLMGNALTSGSLIALFLSAIGLYGLLAFDVSQRRREIGIRMALGAKQIDVLKLVVGQGLKLAFLGIAIGLAGAFALTRVLSSLLYGVTPDDLFSFISASLILTLVAVLSCYLPARRATKVDPMIALRDL